MIQTHFIFWNFYVLDFITLGFLSRLSTYYYFQMVPLSLCSKNIILALEILSSLTLKKQTNKSLSHLFVNWVLDDYVLNWHQEHFG